MVQSARYKNSRKLKVAERMAYVAEQIKKGKSQTDIAKELGIHKSQISRDFAKLMKSYLNQGIVDVHHRIIQQLLELSKLKEEMWDRFDRLKGSPHQGARWPELILACMQREAKILGLDQPEKHLHAHLTGDDLKSKEDRDKIAEAALEQRRRLAYIRKEDKKSYVKIKEKDGEVITCPK